MAIAYILRRFAVVSLLVASVLSVASCQREELFSDPAGNGDGIQLNISCLESMTKAIDATKPGEDTYNENLIQSLDCYFFNGVSASSVHHARFSSLSRRNSVTVYTEITDAQLLRIIPRGSTSCTVYVIANAPAGLSLPENATMAQLNALTFTTSFAEWNSNSQASFVMQGQGTVTLIDRYANKPAAGSVNLYRSAAKLSLCVNVAETVEISHYKQDAEGNYLDEDDNILADQDDQSQWVVSYTETWRSEPAPIGGNGGMQLYLVNAVNFAYMNGNGYHNLSDDSYYHQYTARSFASQKQTFEYEYYNTSSGEVELRNGDFYTATPFYSYPQDLAAVYGATVEPYFKLVVPWSRLNENGDVINTKQYYYKVMMPTDALERNNWYRVMLDVAILGSDVDEMTVSLEPTYYVADWSDADADRHVLSAIPDVRYLSISQDRFIVYNEPSLEIPFLSSENCIYSVTASRFDFRDHVTKDLGNVSSWITVDNANRLVRFNHALDNDIDSPNVDVSPYTINITLQHEDNSSYSKQIQIIQYPGIYIKEEAATGVVFLYGTRNNSNNTLTARPYGRSFIWDRNGTDYSSFNNSTSSVGNTYVSRVIGGKYNRKNGNNTTTITIQASDPSAEVYADHFLGSIMNPTLLTNANYRSTEVSKETNRYKVYVTVLDRNSEYLIGDPRVPEGVTISQLYTTGTNPVTGYLQTSDDAENIIAPAFMLSSSYGESDQPQAGGLKTGKVSGGNMWWPLTYEGARKRCAAYQEDGYPAGRWRLPTKAEMQYLYTLNLSGKLPEILPFRYWVAGNWDFYGGQFYEFSNLQFLGSTRGKTTYAADNIAYSSQAWNASNKPRGSWYTDSANRPAYVSNAEDYTTARCVYDIWYWGEEPVEAYKTTWSGFQTSL